MSHRSTSFAKPTPTASNGRSHGWSMQLDIKKGKPAAWFTYQACQRDHAHAPAIVVVVTNSREVAARGSALDETFA